MSQNALNIELGWVEVLGDSIEWLPRTLKNEILRDPDPKTWTNPAESRDFLKILLAIREAKLDNALQFIEDAFQYSNHQDTLFLLRARVHFLLKQYDKMEACLQGAVQLACDPLTFESTVAEFESLLSTTVSHEPSRLATPNEAIKASKQIDEMTKPTSLKKVDFFPMNGVCASEEVEQSNESIPESTRLPKNASNKDLGQFESPSVSIFCAVYHLDENRHELIEEHLDNIKSQSLPVEPIYVFEAGDKPSNAARSYSIVSPSRLSIYQAWHMAMKHSDTDLVINLNLDDRLCPDAISRMSRYFASDHVMLVGGEWMILDRIGKTQELSNISIHETYFDPAWPPQRFDFTQLGKKLRLGSGTGERGTFGPSTMFRRHLLNEISYPLKFGNGDLIESIGDSLWWSLIKDRYPCGAVRIPEVIGIYHSCPSSQAEFRVTNEWDKFQKWGLM